MLHFSYFSLIVTTTIILFTISLTSSQTFDPNVNDKVYLDAIQTRLIQESLSAHLVVVNQSKILQELTRSFIERKLKENFFKAVRQRVEEELEEMARRNISSSSTLPSRVSRQDDNEDDDDTATVSTTPRPRPGLLPQLSNIVSTFFGSDVNVTGYLKDATSFLPMDLSDRIISAASLIDPARFTSTTPLPTPGPLFINGQFIPQSAFVNGSYTYSFPSGAQSAVIGQPSAGFAPQGGIYQPIIFNQSSPQTQVASPQGVSQQNGNFAAGQQGLAPSLPLAQPGTFQQQSGNYQPQSGNFQQQPGNFQQQPGNFQQQPGNFQQQPGNFQQQPGNFQQQPGNFQQQSGNFQQQPGNVQQQPGTFQQQPGNFQQQPGNFQQQPGTFQQQTGNFQQQPGNFQQQSGNGQQQPGNFQPGTFLQEQQQLEYNLNNGINKVGNPAQNNAGNNPGNNANKPVLNFKVNEAYLPAQAGVPPPQSSDEDEENNNNEESAEDEDDLGGPFARDDQSNTGITYIDEFPAVKYVVDVFKRLTNRANVPTTTEFMFMNATSLGTLDYLDEEEAVKQEATTPKASTVMQILEGGMSLYEGAKEAYMLLQRLNKFLDRVGDRVEDLGYGPEDVGIEL